MMCLTPRRTIGWFLQQNPGENCPNAGHAAFWDSVTLDTTATGLNDTGGMVDTPLYNKVSTEVDLLEVWPLGWQERLHIQKIWKFTINDHQEAQ
jgi:hypothetical protein